MSLPDWISTPCPPPSIDHRDRALARQTVLTKPPGSLGRLEELAVTLAAMQRTDAPSADQVSIVLFAADHGVTAQGISAFPSAVTVEMLNNFVSGGAAICVLARGLDAPLSVIDVGTLADEAIPGVTTDKRRRGTADFSQGPAMTHDDLVEALKAGRHAVPRHRSSGTDIVVLGEMGIGNTTAAAAVAAALVGCAPGDIVGAGTGVDAAGQAHKAEVIAMALTRHDVADADAATVLERVGGLEIAALAGAMIASAHGEIPVLVDGFIVSVAALAAARLNPTVRPWLLFSHRSDERGHGRVLDALEATPLLNLNMRLGEGSGAALALPLIRSACELHNEMATFAEASVSDGS